MALLGGIGGGVTRDVLLNKIPGALTNPAYILLCLAAGIVGYLIAFAGGRLFREGLFQFMTSFSLPWYWRLQLRACRTRYGGAISGVLSGGGEHASRLAVEAVSLALLGGGAGDEISQPVPALLASLVVAACGAAGEPRPAGVTVRRPP